MKDFAAIDLKLANNERSSVCNVGIVIYKDGKKVDDFIHLSNLNQSIITIGVVKYMDCLPRTQRMHLYSLTFGNRLSQR
jgi:hypothetical protein